MNVKGRIYGNNTSNPIGDMKVMLMNDKYEVIDTAITNKDGSFAFKYQPYMRQLVISSDNQENILEAFNNIMVFDNDQNLIKIVSLVKGMKFVYKPLKGEQSRLTELYVDDPWLSVIDKNYSKNGSANTEIIIENIQFDFNKYDLLPAARQSLDKVVLAMALNPNITITLGAHTDSKGSDAYNLKLSEDRANSAKQYLVEKGVAESRIKAVGYGETRLLNRCDNKTTCPEEEHAANRRLEFTLDFHR
ncbi:MAG: OmpA family protein [Bacteroidetes bacterium]|nr:OmpA family protein [Bacteroidota bacterium]